MLGSVQLHLFNGVYHPLLQVGRGHPKCAGHRATDDSSHHNSPPAKLSKAEQRYQNSNCHKRRAAGLYKSNIGNECGSDKNQSESERPPVAAPDVGRMSEQCKRTKRKDTALRNVILDWNAGHLRFAVPWQTGYPRQRRGHQQQQDRCSKEPQNDPPAPVRAPELRQKKWNEQELAKSFQALKPLAQARLGP